MKRDKTQKCTCGKNMPIIPYCCKKCGSSSLVGKKIEIVNLGIKLTEKSWWEDEFDKEFGELFCFIDVFVGVNERKRVKDFIKNHFVEANKMVVDNKIYEQF